MKHLFFLVFSFFTFSFAEWPCKAYDLYRDEMFMKVEKYKAEIENDKASIQLVLARMDVMKNAQPGVNLTSAVNLIEQYKKSIDTRQKWISDIYSNFETKAKSVIESNCN